MSVICVPSSALGSKYSATIRPVNRTLPSVVSRACRHTFCRVFIGDTRQKKQFTSVPFQTDVNSLPSSGDRHSAKPTNQNVARGTTCQVGHTTLPSSYLCRVLDASVLSLGVSCLPSASVHTVKLVPSAYICRVWAAPLLSLGVRSLPSAGGHSVKLGAECFSVPSVLLLPWMDIYREGVCRVPSFVLGKACSQVAGVDWLERHFAECRTRHRPIMHICRVLYSVNRTKKWQKHFDFARSLQLNTIFIYFYILSLGALTHHIFHIQKHSNIISSLQALTHHIYISKSTQTQSEA